ncbi:uncharacterized protein LOC123552542 [Mercenaria mercenaria]|uniref:uncharacterized protein LOC123552542 n=1 Tax=Mercenaria mercenaria TaxID=6596 RepID=UPI00234F8F37|nr:uncharacterized protein LOC123552542 [Mercenaria mercenaria]
MSDATGTVTPCPTNEVTMTDDARNYIIIALSIVLGIMSIGIIIWCVLSRVQRNKVSYMKNNMVSTGTQTDDYISKELYFRPLPPIDTQMKVVSAKPLFDVHTKFSTPEKHPIDIHIEIVSEDHLDTKIDIFPESKCKTCVELPTAHDSIPQNMNRSSAFETEYTTNNFTTKPIPISSSSESDSDTLSNKCDDFKAKYFKDTDDIFQVESSTAHAGIPSPDDENFDTSPLEAGATPLACETNATSLDSKASEKELLGESEAVKEILFIHTLNVSDLDKANDENIMSKANITNAGMENKRPSFQITHCFNEEVEEIISLDTEDKVPKVRHVTFKEPQGQTTDHKSSSVETGVSDNTLIGPKFRGLLTTNTNTVETSPDKLKMNRKRKRVVRKKSPYTDPIKSSTLKSQAQKRYEATYNIIADAYFKPDFTKEKVWNHLKKFSTRNKLRLKAKTKSKRNISQSEPKFQSEPYGSGSLYSRLSDFES